ncbi:MAG: hypothetical protein ABR954_09155 [Dehalococcoidales bacterium]
MKKQLNNTKKRGFLTLAMAMAIVTLLTIATPVMADAPVSHTITLLSGGSTQTAGFTLTNPVADPLNPSLYSGSGTWSAAPVVADQPSVWVQFSSAQWVSTTAADSGTEGGYTGDSWRLMRDQFTVPTGANITSATLRIASDNAFELYFNGTFIDSTATWGPDTTVYGPSPEPVDNETPFRFSVIYTITPHVGTNTFVFVVRNWDNLGSWNPTGLLYATSITYEESSQPPTTPPAVGGTVFPVDKYQLLLPWFGVGLGALLVVFLAINRLFFRKKQHISHR